MGIIVPWTVFMRISKTACKVPNMVTWHNEHSINVFFIKNVLEKQTNKKEP